MKLRTRIERMEARKGAGTDDVVTRQALQRLSAEDLETLESIALENVQGKKRSEFTERESSAMAAYDTAFEQELQLAGFRSRVEFEESCCRRR